MRILAILTASSLLALATTLPAAEQPAPLPESAGTAQLGPQARALIQTLGARLLGELGAAMRDGGPVAAVGVCQTRAPVISAAVGDEAGWQVGRTSERVRNPANAPDAWEAAVLKQFAERKAAGESLASMRYAEVVQIDGQKTYRYMQAIPVGAPCLACHGSDLTPELVQAIDKAYPADQARGYAVGDLRGAFTLQRPL